MSRNKNTKLVERAKQYVATNVGPRFHDKLLDGLKRLKLRNLLKRKNPYLFKAKAIYSAGDLVKRLLDAYLSSKEETIFGDFLESLAIFVCSEAYQGKKSNAEGIDLEFDRDGKRYLISIKSGPNWGNSQQIKRMTANFNQARKVVGKQAHVEAVNGCCYGQESQPHKGSYIKLCGQDFWALVSGSDEFYKEIVGPLGYEAKQRTDAFEISYSAVINQFTAEFIATYCSPDGAIDWGKLLEFNSGRITR